MKFEIWISKRFLSREEDLGMSNQRKCPFRIWFDSQFLQVSSNVLYFAQMEDEKHARIEIPL